MGPTIALFQCVAVALLKSPSPMSTISILFVIFRACRPVCVRISAWDKRETLELSVDVPYCSATLAHRGAILQMAMTFQATFSCAGDNVCHLKTVGREKVNSALRICRITARYPRKRFPRFVRLYNLYININYIFSKPWLSMRAIVCFIQMK